MIDVLALSHKQGLINATVEHISVKKIKDKVRALLDHKKFAEELKKLGKTQEEFAEENDISDRYVRNLETTDKNISISMAYSISQVFGVMIEDMIVLVDEDEDDEANS